MDAADPSRRAITRQARGRATARGTHSKTASLAFSRNAYNAATHLLVDQFARKDACAIKKNSTTRKPQGYPLRDISNHFLLSTEAAVKMQLTPDFVRREIRGAKRTVIRTCLQCGAVNGEQEEFCCFCDSRLILSAKPATRRPRATPIEGNLAVEPDWKREVSSRLNAYRLRRDGGAGVGAQSALSFEAEESVASESTELPPAVELAVPRPKSQPARAARNERVEILIPNRQTEIFADEPESALSCDEGRVGGALMPVAALSLRRRAATLDLLFLLLSFGGVLALFWVLGGRFSLNWFDGTVIAAALCLFYAQYFALFTIFGGSTPGMNIEHLRVISYDGFVPTSKQMVWRSIGYLISAGACLMGFLWAVWDDDHLCWHDRMSQTYVTLAENMAPHSAQAKPPEQPGLIR
jgi:uncharacterized RDD family membrane protein YckC